MQLIAEILARSVALARYESVVRESFDRIEPWALSMQTRGVGGQPERHLLKHLGSTLLIQHRMSGRIETITSMFGDTKEPIFGSFLTSGGYEQYSVTPTTRVPRPRAKRISVIPGAVETIRCGAACAAHTISNNNAYRLLTRAAP